MFQGVSIQRFNQYFKEEDDCRQYLFELKWKEGYRCRRCGCIKSHKGKTRFHLRCQRCGYDESVTAHTVFHKLKIPLLKAFGMIFRLSVKKKGMSTTELAREFSINQKSSWLFKRKAQEAMKSTGNHLLDKKAGVVDEFLIEGFEKEKQGRSNREQDLIVIDFENGKVNKTGRAYGKMIKKARGEYIDSFFKRHTDNDLPIITTVGRRGYWALESEIEFRQGRSYGIKSITGSNIVILNLKAWLRGIHHHCSRRFINGYLDEFFFRFNGRNLLTSIWHELVERFMANKPYNYIANAI